jgi:hypothetical protein
MSSIKLESNASGTGIFTIASPNSNTNRTLTLPDNTGTILTGSSAITASQLPAGSVLQVVQTYKNNVTSIATTGVAVSGLSVSITPSSSSNKILITSGIYVGTDSGSNQCYPSFSLRRNSSQIGAATGATGNQINSTAALGMNTGTSMAYDARYISHQYLDSPATTSAITYDWYLINNGGYTNVIINRIGNNSNNAYVAYSTSFITVMEIAA